MRLVNGNGGLTWKASTGCFSDVDKITTHVESVGGKVSAKTNRGSLLFDGPANLDELVDKSIVTLVLQPDFH